MTYQSDQSTENHFILPPASCEAPPPIPPVVSTQNRPGLRGIPQAPLPTNKTIAPPSFLPQPDDPADATSRLTSAHASTQFLSLETSNTAASSHAVHASLCPLHNPLVKTTLGAPVRPITSVVCRISCSLRLTATSTPRDHHRGKGYQDKPCLRHGGCACSS